MNVVKLPSSLWEIKTKLVLRSEPVSPGEPGCVIIDLTLVKSQRLLKFNAFWGLIKSFCPWLFTIILDQNFKLNSMDFFF